jgi:hypothetical protein
MKKNLKNKYYSPQKKVLSKSYSFKALNMTKFGAVQAQWMHSLGWKVNKNMNATK